MLHEFPLANFDDRGPASLAQLAADVVRREEAGETVWEVVQAGQAIGVIGYAEVSKEVAALHGICFSKDVHGSGIPLAAVTMALKKIFVKGYEKVVAAHFSDNAAVTKFLAKLGAVEHHGDRHSVPRGGILIDVRIVEIKASDFLAMRRVA